ncbi:Aconitate hydratase AcnA [Planctomycetales bacterium 10988]|nr:Aconitate hydratase AcnA [Planctomycetales bacterium 10988]
MNTPQANQDPFGARDTFSTSQGEVGIYRLQSVEEHGLGTISALPYSIRLLLEAALRTCDGFTVTEDDIRKIAGWKPKADEGVEIAFKPARVILQDFTGVPALVDLAAMRNAMQELGGNPEQINPLIPVDLVIDHSVQVDRFGIRQALQLNVEIEFERNRERYEFLHWGQKAFDNFRVVPPSVGIVHQVNLEYLAKCVFLRQDEQGPIAVPDTLVGTDSHTTMINGLGVLGWGVGGIEAEAVMLGQPIYMLLPEVVGFELTGRLAAGATATDLVLMVTEMLRQKGVVGKFVEFYGPGLDALTLADRATISNMAPEYGATMGFFPVDANTLTYLRQTGRTEVEVELVEKYCKEQGLFRTADSPVPEFSDTLSLDMGTVEPSLAGPKRPQDRVPLKQMKSSFEHSLVAPMSERGFALDSEKMQSVATVQDNGHSTDISHGAVVIAAITSCTNTSNPSVMIGAGLLAKKAVEKGLNVKPYVKTSLAPGSRVVTDYLDRSGLQPYLEQLGFHTVGYGCTTCIGNSGPLPEPVAKAVAEKDLVASAVLSGNRNFEGRVNPMVKANYLASPPLVVAYALAGTTDIDLVTEPIGFDQENNPVMLTEIWPTHEEISEAIVQALTPDMYQVRYGKVFQENEVWNAITSPEGELYEWDDASTYIQLPPFFQGLAPQPEPIGSIEGARVLALMEDSVTTDHISPAGAIKADSPAGKYLQENGVEKNQFNSYGSRRGNDRVMTRGTFANIRIRNQLAPGTEGGVTRHLPDGEQMAIYDAAMKYAEEKIPLVILAGAEYGTGSSRDWAAKGTLLLGVKAVIASSFERIHRSNLVGMGILPLQFMEGETWKSLGLNGEEIYDFAGLDDQLTPGKILDVTATAADGSKKTFQAKVRIDTPVEVEYYRNGGILQTVLRKMRMANPE